MQNNLPMPDPAALTALCDRVAPHANSTHPCTVDPSDLRALVAAVRGLMAERERLRLMLWAIVESKGEIEIHHSTLVRAGAATIEQTQTPSGNIRLAARATPPGTP